MHTSSLTIPKIGHPVGIQLHGGEITQFAKQERAYGISEAAIRRMCTMRIRSLSMLLGNNGSIWCIIDNKSILIEIN